MINAADLTAIDTKDNLLSTDDFEVVGVARLVDVTNGGLGTIAGHNLSAVKPDGLAGGA